jgi:hypothetical protein
MKANLFHDDILHFLQSAKMHENALNAADFSTIR